jgi:hypothetical protein
MASRAARRCWPQEAVRAGLGSDQERGLRKAATAAVGYTAAEMNLSAKQARQLATVISKAFRKPVQDAPLTGPVTDAGSAAAGRDSKTAGRAGQCRADCRWAIVVGGSGSARQQQAGGSDHAATHRTRCPGGPGRCRRRTAVSRDPCPGRARLFPVPRRRCTASRRFSGPACRGQANARTGSARACGQTVKQAFKDHDLNCRFQSPGQYLRRMGRAVAGWVLRRRCSQAAMSTCWQKKRQTCQAQIVCTVCSQGSKRLSATPPTLTARAWPAGQRALTQQSRYPCCLVVAVLAAAWHPDG